MSDIPMSDIRMSDICIAPAALKRVPGCIRGSAARAAGCWLSLAAAPTFAIMVLLTVCSGAGPDMVCGSMQHASTFGGMTVMYLLMSVFHVRPWLKLLAKSR